MKKTIPSILLLIFTTLASAAHLGSLVGRWTAVGKTYNWENKAGLIKYTVDIRKQDGNFLSGVLQWKSLTPQKYHVKDVASSEATEPFIGLINPHTHAITLVETTEVSLINATLQPNKTLHVTYVEPGAHAVVFQADMHKEK